MRHSLGPAAVLGAMVLGAAGLAGCGGTGASAAPPARTRTPVPTATAVPAPTGSAAISTSSSAPPKSPPPARPPFAVGLRVITFVDHYRTVVIPGRGRVPRTLVTLIRYPALGPSSRIDAPDAPAASGAGPFPLIIFGHGFAVTPTPYAPLLQAWARAGYVVVAPIFPLENANAPGGPDESDLINQPGDMSFLITQMLAESQRSSGPFAGLLERGAIAATGQSDGGETALAVAYDSQFRDRRVAATVILSGAEIPGVGGFTFPPPSPPLLATQGTADTINPPGFTNTFYALAPPPKYLLELFGASHLPPYTHLQPQLGIVERVTIAFLDYFLKHEPEALQRMRQSGALPGISAVLGDG
ncbi:MAG: alpha/beta hydrolase family protein [Solirubrobacteraceae bacterium]